MTSRHHHDHGLRFLRRNQIVQDESGAAHRRPGIVAVARAMQQIEDRKLPASHLVSRRRVDMHAPEPRERRRVVSHGCHRAVRHVGRVHEFCAGHIDQAPVVGIRLAHRWISRVHGRNAIHHEGVSVRAGIDRVRRWPTTSRRHPSRMPGLRAASPVCRRPAAPPSSPVAPVCGTRCGGPPSTSGETTLIASCIAGGGEREARLASRLARSAMPPATELAITMAAIHNVRFIDLLMKNGQAAKPVLLRRLPAPRFGRPEQRVDRPPCCARRRLSAPALRPGPV